MFDPIDIENELAREREKRYSQAVLLFEAEKLLYDAASKDRAISNRINSKCPTVPIDLSFDNLNYERIYSEDDISKIFASNKLQFLDSYIFKGSIPYEAIARTRKEEEILDATFTKFKIVAPSVGYRLNNNKDNFLFADLGNGQYYLIHKWSESSFRYKNLIHSFSAIFKRLLQLS